MSGDQSSGSSAEAADAPRVQIKHGGKIIFDFAWNGALTLGELRAFCAKECDIDEERLTLLYKGKKLQGVAFPPDSRLDSVVRPGKNVLIQAMGTSAKADTTTLLSRNRQVLKRVAKTVLGFAERFAASGAPSKVEPVAAQAIRVREAYEQSSGGTGAGTGRTGVSADPANMPDLVRYIGDAVPSAATGSSNPEEAVGLKKDSPLTADMDPSSILDMLSLTKLSTELDSLDDLGDAERSLRRQLLMLLEILETCVQK
ncbi:unnamed protein product [Amoebophrya sp. A25]|nr:unnamed protein product [Amoebophrya sp. A25]|eukprot:GSA25T00005450001.1